MTSLLINVRTAAEGDDAVTYKRGREDAVKAHQPAGAGDPELVPWLSAIDGIAYLVDSDAIVLAVGGAGWWSFNEQVKAGPALTPDALLGRNLFDQMSGSGVRAHYRTLHRRVFQECRPHIAFECRCDAPDVKRTMRLAIGHLSLPGRSSVALYQSQILSAIERPWMSLFEPSRIIEAIRAEASLPIISMCSVCARVMLPFSAKARPENWIEADEYYARGGPSDVRISHTVCEPCTETFAHFVG